MAETPATACVVPLAGKGIYRDQGGPRQMIRKVRERERERERERDEKKREMGKQNIKMEKIY